MITVVPWNAVCFFQVCLLPGVTPCLCSCLRTGCKGAQFQQPFCGTQDPTYRVVTPETGPWGQQGPQKAVSAKRASSCASFGEARDQSLYGLEEQREGKEGSNRKTGQAPVKVWFSVAFNNIDILRARERVGGLSGWLSSWVSCCHCGVLGYFLQGCMNTSLPLRWCQTLKVTRNKAFIGKGVEVEKNPISWTHDAHPFLNWLGRTFPGTLVFLICVLLSGFFGT